MARMIPSEFPPVKPGDTGALGERMVYEALQRMPEDWMVIHNCWRHLLQEDKESENPKHVSYEADFIVLIPGCGILVMEVKNSGKGDRGLKFEREKLLLKYRKMEQDIATLENNMGFFARTKNADSMIADVKKKINIAREELARIEEKIKIIDNQFES